MEKPSSHLDSIPSIVSVEEIRFVGKVRELASAQLNSVQFEKAETRSRLIRAYKFVYTSQGHKVTGFVVEPIEGENLPCIIYNRGGSNDFGKLDELDLFLRLAEFALWGYVVIASQYSGCDGGEGKDEFGGSDIEDVLSLHEIIKAHPRIDSTKIGMYGASRGGLMTYLSLARVNWVKAAVVVSGVADEVNAPNFREGWADHQNKMYGGSLEEREKRSAVLWADKFNKQTPLLLMHGTADWRVNPQDSITLASELLKNKVPCRLILFEGGDHLLSEFRQEKSEQARAWFERYLKNSVPIDLEPHGK